MLDASTLTVAVVIEGAVQARDEQSHEIVFRVMTMFEVEDVAPE